MIPCQLYSGPGLSTVVQVGAMTIPSRTSLLIIVIILLGVSGCDSDNGVSYEIDPARYTPSVDWLKHNLIEGNVEPRLVNGLGPDGFYQPLLRNDWTPKPEQKATLISQTRFIYVMAMGYEVTSDKRYLDAMTRAADYLLKHFSNPDIQGHWFREVLPDGQVGNRSFHAYGYAQVVFALAHAYKITGNSRYFDAAMHTWLALDVPGAINGNNRFYNLRGLNVAMHLFESLLVLYKATEHPKIIGQDLSSLAEYIVDHFYDPKLGVFVEDLTPTLDRAADGEIRLGHAIEMAFLLSRAVDAGLPASYLKPANASVDFVSRQAAKNPRGMIPHTINYNGSIRDPEQYWWCQTELLRGLAHFSMHRNRTDLTAQFKSSLDQVQNHFIDPVYGGWYKKPDAPELDKGEQWKVGYHVTMMLTELMRLNEVSFRSGSEVLL